MATSTRSRAPANGESTEPKSERPVETIRRWVGGATVDVAIFAKEHSRKTGDGGVYTRKTYFVVVSKSWRKKQEEGYTGPAEYGSSSAFNPHELLELADAIQVAHKRCLELQKGEPQDDGGDESPF
jgi:hypothetical protein